MTQMENRVIQTFQSWLQKDYERNKLNIPLGGWTALVAHPAYYFICTYLLSGYDDSAFFRFCSALISLPLIIRPWSSKLSKSWLTVYWYCWITFILPVSFTFILLMNSFAPMWIVCETMMIFVTLVFIGNFFRVFLVLGIGIPIGYACFICHTGQTFNWTQAIEAGNHPIWHLFVPLPIAMWCGIIFMFGARAALIALEKNEAIKTLAGSIAHEMRNPFGQIKNSFDGIMHLLPIPSTLTLAQNIQMSELNALYEKIAHGQIAVTRGLQVITLTLGEVNGKPIDQSSFEYLEASEITQKAMDEYSFDSENERSRVFVQVERDFKVNVNETIFIFILFNLIKNALYYFTTHPNATITIKLDQNTITVRDTGPGISRHIQSKLFDNFMTSDKKGGTGLGLSFCKRAMRAFGGDIHCESVLGAFTEFILRFPPVSSAEYDTYVSNVFLAAKNAFRGKRILIVDDQPELLTLATQMFEELSIEYDCVENGQEAIDILNLKPFDFVLMDLNMPVLDGYAATELIRKGAVPLQRNIPILAHTSEIAYMAKIKTRKVGMDGFISKPCTKLALLEALCQVLESARQKTCTNQADDTLMGKTILIVDDELFNRQNLQNCVSEWGVQTLFADSGPSALAMLAKEPDIDIIFMDMRMPLMSGFDTARHIRASYSQREIIIVAISADSGEKFNEDTKAAGIDACFTKPVDKNSLRHKLCDLIAAKIHKRKTLEMAFLLTEKYIDSTDVIRTVSDNKINSSAHIESSANVPLKTETSSAENRYIPLHESQSLFFNDLPLLDYERLALSESDYKNNFQNFLQSMIKNLLKRNDELQIAFNSKNLNAITDVLHSLKGIAGTVGANALNQYINLRLYSQVSKGNFPEEEAWAETVNALVIASINLIDKDWVE